MLTPATLATLATWTPQHQEHARPYKQSGMFSHSRMILMLQICHRGTPTTFGPRKTILTYQSYLLPAGPPG